MKIDRRRCGCRSSGRGWSGRRRQRSSRSSRSNRGRRRRHFRWNIQMLLIKILWGDFLYVKIMDRRRDGEQSEIENTK
jgi:hypothetical protein